MTNIWIFEYSYHFQYEYSFVSYSYCFFLYEYILIFIRIIFLIRIYSDICSYRFLDINIFEYSFVSKIYIRHTLVCGSRGSGALGPRCWVGDGEQLGEMACFAEGKQIWYLYWYQNSSFDLSIMKNIRIHYTHLLGCKQRIINVQQGWRLWSLWISCWGGEGPLNVC